MPAYLTRFDNASARWLVHDVTDFVNERDKGDYGMPITWQYPCVLFVSKKEF